MARRRFFVSAVRNGEASVEGDEAQHLTRVLRVEPGQIYEISDNHQAWLAEVTLARKQHVTFRAIEPVAPRPAVVRIHLYAALIKFDHFEWMVEKATEIGVERIVPFRAERSDRGLEQAAMKRVERWRRIGIEASQQSRRDRLPVVEEPTTFDGVLLEDADCRLFCDEQPGATGLLQSLPDQRTPEDRVALVIGPEGGWTEVERAKFSEVGWMPVTLGPPVLRAETAAVAASAVVLAAWL